MPRKNQKTHTHLHTTSDIPQCPAGEIDLNPEVGILTLTFNVDIEAAWYIALLLTTWAGGSLLQIEYATWLFWLGIEG